MHSTATVQKKLYDSPRNQQQKNEVNHIDDLATCAGIVRPLGLHVSCHVGPGARRRSSPLALPRGSCRARRRTSRATASPSCCWGCRAPPTPCRPGPGAPAGPHGRSAFSPFPRRPGPGAPAARASVRAPSTAAVVWGSSTAALPRRRPRSRSSLRAHTLGG
jgi:hypothetical protein